MFASRLATLLFFAIFLDAQFTLNPLHSIYGRFAAASLHQLYSFAIFPEALMCGRLSDGQLVAFIYWQISKKIYTKGQILSLPKPIPLLLRLPLLKRLPLPLL